MRTSKQPRTSNKPSNKPSKLWADEKFVTQTYGITHTPLFNLRKTGAIRSLSLKAEGKSYGKRLYHIPSLEAWLAECEAREGGSK